MSRAAGVENAREPAEASEHASQRKRRQNSIIRAADVSEMLSTQDAPVLKTVRCWQEALGIPKAVIARHEPGTPEGSLVLETHSSVSFVFGGFSRCKIDTDEA